MKKLCDTLKQADTVHKRDRCTNKQNGLGIPGTLHLHATL